MLHHSYFSRLGHPHLRQSLVFGLRVVAELAGYEAAHTDSNSSIDDIDLVGHTLNPHYADDRMLAP